MFRAAFDLDTHAVQFLQRQASKADKESGYKAGFYKCEKCDTSAATSVPQLKDQRSWWYHQVKHHSEFWALVATEPDSQGQFHCPAGDSSSMERKEVLAHLTSVDCAQSTSHRELLKTYYTNVHTHYHHVYEQDFVRTALASLAADSLDSPDSVKQSRVRKTQTPVYVDDLPDESLDPPEPIRRNQTNMDVEYSPDNSLNSLDSPDLPELVGSTVHKPRANVPPMDRATVGQKCKDDLCNL
ncbi:hypothetical protein B0H15DRAFT_807055 [Mycena belliarum]|uniref:Uncharacterized protein n=1 Tax=Mycena belliarum TaxID=1033014 RepID=A0AAD6TNA4_9AGAR|nr:hypothetical protein B0H15DRAFT_807055 [Mycena belliae]